MYSKIVLLLLLSFNFYSLRAFVYSLLTMDDKSASRYLFDIFFTSVVETIEDMFKGNYKIRITIIILTI